MCGILAWYSREPRTFDPELIARMRDTMLHRGPDDAGVFMDEHIALAHRRLSIIDLTPSGHQPMFDEDSNYAVTYNGEIYNYVELRKDLETRGHRFQSTCDTEVIIHQYEEDGPACVEKFNGMFSFAIWDRRKQLLFAARDRIGIKPLCYRWDSKNLVIASEIKAIIEDRSVPRKPDLEAVTDYLFAGHPLMSRTMFEGIKELEPGSWLMIGREQPLVIRKYWDLKYQYNMSRPLEQVVEELISLIDNAVMIHCRSDAPVGAHLSGGLDSSTIVAFAAKHVRPLKTFSIKFSNDPAIDETRYAKAVAGLSRCEYLERSPTAEDLFSLYPMLTWHLEQPMNNSGFSYYTASKFAKEHVKVSLTGHGGDELFAGYPAQFKAAYNVDNFARPPVYAKNISTFQKARQLLKSDIVRIGRSVRDKMIPRETQSFQQLWVNLHCNSLTMASMLYNKDFQNCIAGYSPEETYLYPFSCVTDAAILDKCLYHDLKIYLPSLLHAEDRVSMSVSLESRVPLLDYRIAEFLATVPPEQKVFNLQPKYLLRRSAEAILPSEVVSRKEKMPFPVPSEFWRSMDMKQLLKELLTDHNSFARDIFSPAAIKEAVKYNAMSPYLLGLEMWHRIFIRNEYPMPGAQSKV